jgi:putative pyruvate formate lyase activating enzyme
MEATPAIANPHTMPPAYLELHASGQLAQRVEEAYRHLTRCDVCPRACGAERLAGKLGVCHIGARAVVASYGPHHGEERPLRGRRGSGTVFFSGCNLHCQFCQNADISQGGSGKEVEPDGLAAIFLQLQDMGCHNINLVSPSHVIPQILAAVDIAAGKGLGLPLVYTTGGYDAVAMLQLLDGVIDIYLPDMKYNDPKAGLKYSRVRDYPKVNQLAVYEMYRQVGDLEIDPQGLAQRGLLVRHLVLPHHLAGTRGVAHFLASQVSPHTYLNVMDQYLPAFNAARFPELNRPITPQEHRQAVDAAIQNGLQRLEITH